MRSASVELLPLQIFSLSICLVMYSFPAAWDILEKLFLNAGVSLRVSPNKALPKKYLLSVLVFLLLAGCASEFLSNGELNQNEAIDTAVKIASTSMPEISGSQVVPSNSHAEKMTLQEAAKRLNSNPQNAFGEESPDMQVWLVSMHGVWLPTTLPGVVQKPYQHLSIVIDAKTGLEIFRNMQP